MKTCSDCSYFSKCEMLISAKPTSNECDWIPSRFSLNTNWVSCDKRLPEDGVRVLVLYDTPFEEDCIDLVWLDKGIWWKTSNCALDRIYEVPKYWNPLPELPTDTDRLVVSNVEDI